MIMVEIVMGTYNGSEFISQQIDSIMQQTYQDILLTIHDDGSGDHTNKLLVEAQQKYGAKIEIKYYPPQGGAAKNFASLAELSSKQYVMFADQDDIWYERKVENAVRVIQFYESVYGQSIPLMIHTDLDLIDSSGKSINRRLWDYQKLNPMWADKFSRLLTQNVVTGCTMMVNRSLIDLALPLPKNAVMHDWWFALVACAFGKIIYIEEPDIGYRQHDKNVVGAKQFSLMYVLRKSLNFWHREHRKESLMLTSKQAQAFYERYPTSDHGELAKIYADLPSSSRISKMKLIVANDFRKIGWQRQIAWLFL